MESHRAGSFGQALITTIGHHRMVFGIMAAYWALCLLLGAFSGRAVNPFLYAPVFLLIFLLLTAFVVGRSMMDLRRSASARVSWSAVREDLNARYTQDDRVRIVLMFAGLSVTLSLFQSVKAMIPAINPFALDARFAEMDRMLHGGFYPHEILQPFMGYPVVSLVTLILYNLWLPLVFLVFCRQILDGTDPALQKRYLVSFVLAWFLIGTLGAIGLSSAGPVYYEQVTELAPGTGPYAGLIAYYGDVGSALPFFLTDMHEMLWGFYQSGAVAPGAGISAMPSVHVALALHMFLVARHEGPRLAWLFGIYAGVIMLGSVHLGWHYAIDGYLGAAMMLAIWWFSGLLAKPLDEHQGLLR